MITAHSGCDGTPENSLEFLRTALQSEADAVEVDVRKNGEGKLILSHDETQEGGHGTVGPGRCRGSQEEIARFPPAGER